MPGLDILPALPPRVPTLIQIRAAYKPGVLSTIRTIKACLWRSSRRSENTTDRISLSSSAVSPTCDTRRGVRVHVSPLSVSQIFFFTGHQARSVSEDELANGSSWSHEPAASPAPCLARSLDGLMKRAELTHEPLACRLALYKYTPRRWKQERTDSSARRQESRYLSLVQSSEVCQQKAGLTTRD
ncbi:hypothetical protein NQZ68_027399 [Dissostichus eleginoides]|nr:hypothetical protein NQZ68_027399 [Dissostichus eleginoides]